MKKSIITLWHKSKWHLLAAVFTFAFTICGNLYNFMGLAKAYANQIEGSQYFFQLAICTGGSFLVAYCAEIVQGFLGANATEEEFNKEAKPDIKVSTIAGFTGSLLAIIYFLKFC